MIRRGFYRRVTMRIKKTTSETPKVHGVMGIVFLVCALAAPAMGGTRSFRTGSYEDAGRPQARRGESVATERLRSIMMPLIRAMDQPCPPDEVRVQIMNQSEINAGNAGGCQFLVTEGLLRQASDDQLRGVLAHELAHQDLGHVARAQVLNTGLSIGAALLERIFPGGSAVAPIAGALIARGHSRTEEYAADRHAVEILGRAGYPTEIMIETLGWLRGVSGHGGGGILSTHPAIDERISALRKLR
jgi:beta-barrel assembly-enhancing protease